MLSPAQAIISAPYAIQAINAATAADLSGTLAATSLTGTFRTRCFPRTWRCKMREQRPFRETWPPPSSTAAAPGLTSMPANQSHRHDS